MSFTLLFAGFAEFYFRSLFIKNNHQICSCLLNTFQCCVSKTLLQFLHILQANGKFPIQNDTDKINSKRSSVLNRHQTLLLIKSYSRSILTSKLFSCHQLTENESNRVKPELSFFVFTVRDVNFPVIDAPPSKLFIETEQHDQTYLNIFYFISFQTASSQR